MKKAVKQIKYACMLTAILVSAKLCQCCQMSTGSEKPQFSYVEYFKNGDTIFPSYACPYTLVVTNAEGLNAAFGPIEQDTTGERGGDLDIDTTFHKYCETID